MLYSFQGSFQQEVASERIVMGILRLAVLGPPLVEHQGEALVLPTRKTLALLIYDGN